MNYILEQRRDQIKLVCIHEIGHYILAKEMRFETRGVGVQFERNGSHKGYSTFMSLNPNMDTLEKMRVFLERRVKTLYAGVIAESFDENGCYNSDYAETQWTVGGGIQDYGNIRELVRLIRDIDFPETMDEEKINLELENLNTRLIDETKDIVLKRLDLIRGIATTLSDKVVEFSIKYTMTEEELNGIISIRDLYSK